MAKDDQISLKFAELHNPLFLAGKNFGLKLDPVKTVGMKLTYDRAEKELLVDWDKEQGIIPSSNIACMVPGIPAMKTANELHPIVAALRAAQGETQITMNPTFAALATAQVDTPMSHVYAGEGHGKTGKSK